METYHQQLLDPRAYPEESTGVSFIETHISRLYLTDSHVYKFKKPLNLRFLDFSTLEQRKFFCEEEIRLNRRFCPNIYEDVVALRHCGGTVRICDDGDVVDYAVRMRRLPEERMLSSLIRQHQPGLEHETTRLAEHLAGLWEKAPACFNANGEANALVVQRNCLENLEQTECCIGRSLHSKAHALAGTYTRAALDSLYELLLQREQDGHVRDGHGDLHTANICMTEEIQVYDCIEFNRKFRIADVAADLAFLLMDLDFLGRRDLSTLFYRRYQELAPDPDLDTLIPFYKFYRAWVRGKVDCLLAAEPDVAGPTRKEANSLARRYFNLALGYLMPSALYLMTGLMGSGKSTLAKALADATGATLLRSDSLRKQLAGHQAIGSGNEAFGEGLYREEMTTRTYNALLTETERLLNAGETVIVDASFSRETERTRFIDLAGKKGVNDWLLHVHCPEEVALERLDQRRRLQTDVSDGRPELYRIQANHFEPLAKETSLLSIDSTASVDYNVQTILCTVLENRGVMQ